MMKKMAIWLVVGVCASVVAAGCTSKVRGEPTAVAAGGSSSPSSDASDSSSSPDPSGTPGPGGPSGSSDPDSGSDSGLAAYRTVDVCSFLRTDAFQKLDSAARPQVSTGDYSSCYLSLELKDKNKKVTSFQLVTQFLDGSDAQTVGNRVSAQVTQTTREGKTLFSATSKQNGCVRGIVLTDGLTLLVSARAYTTGVTPVQACPVADAMTDSAFAVISQDSATPLQLPRNSLAAQDLCDKLGAAAATFLGGEPEPAHQLHGCAWAAGRTGSISLSLDSDDWPPGFPPTNAKTEQFGGRPALVSVNASPTGTFSINDVRMGPAPVGSKKYDVVTVIAASSEKPAQVGPKVRQFLAAVAGLS